MESAFFVHGFALQSYTCTSSLGQCIMHIYVYAYYRGLTGHFDPSKKAREKKITNDEKLSTDLIYGAKITIHVLYYYCNFHDVLY